MTNKFVRNEWGGTGLRRIGYARDNNIEGTRDLFDLFQSFEILIEKFRQFIANTEDYVTYQPNFESYDKIMKEIAEAKEFLNHA